MTDTEIVPIQDGFDIIEARVRVRNLARDLGFDLFDQARISLATSTLAYILGMGREAAGQVTLQACHSGTSRGIQVVCLRVKPSRHEIPIGVLDDARRMVDDLTVQVMDTGETCVTLVKWFGRPPREAAPSEPANSQSPRTIL